MDDDELTGRIEAEIFYLHDLRNAGRSSDLAARVAVLRDHGWEMTTIAEGLGMSRQWLYQLLANHPEAKAPVDGPQVLDLRPSPGAGLAMRQDLAAVPPPICDALPLMWRRVVQDKSGGVSPPSVDLDVTIALLARRGVPYVKIAKCGGVTHRAAIQRVRRAVERGTMPEAIHTSFLTVGSFPPPRTRAEVWDPRRLYAVVQVVATSFTRYYSLRRRDGSLYLFDPSRNRRPDELAEAGLAGYHLILSENELVDAVAEAGSESSPVYAVPVQWLYTESARAAGAWTRDVFDPAGFYPPGLDLHDPDVLSWSRPAS